LSGIRISPFLILVLNSMASMARLLKA
jgi:hypothetical protein